MGLVCVSINPFLNIGSRHSFSPRLTLFPRLPLTSTLPGPRTFVVLNQTLI